MLAAEVSKHSAEQKLAECKEKLAAENPLNYPLVKSWLRQWQ